MRFTFDEPKRQANLEKHGFDFAEFEEASSFDRVLGRPMRPSRTGRERFLLIGSWFDEAVVTVIVSPLGAEATDIVSIRHASRQERIAYDRI